MLRNAFKIALIATLSSCAGKPPVMDHPVQVYYGVHQKRAMCPATRAQVARWVTALAKQKLSKKYAARVVYAALKPDALECIGSDQEAFDTLIALPSADFEAVLKFQEDLLYSCEKWKN